MTHMRFASVRRFLRREDGTTMVEFAICISLFLLLLFAVLDFARLGYTWVSAEKAMQIGARTAAVRYPVCTGVPIVHFREVGTPADYPPGTLCREDGGICVQTTPDPRCLLSESLTLAGSSNEEEQKRFEAGSQIWARMNALLPDNVGPENVRITYAYDKNLGFVGGPYIPLITAELVDSGSDSCNGNPCFTFVTPLSALAANAGSTLPDDMPNKGGTIPFPGIAATVPAEDLNRGMDG